MKKIIFFVIVLGVFLSCASHPRFTLKTEDNYPLSESKIDKKLMGRIIKSYLGVPYKEKGLSHLGIDCSGLVVEVYRRYNGIKLPRDVNKLFKLAKKVKRKNLAYGDLVFFTIDFREVTHVGIYVDHGEFVQSSKSRGVVISSLDESYYNRRYVGARRVIP